MARFTFVGASPSGMVTLLGASVLALGLAYAVPGGAAATTSNEVTASVAAPSVWKMTNHIAKSSCTARPGPRISSTHRPVEVDEACEDVLSSLTDAVLWREDRDGSVSLIDETGKVVIAFIEADGHALEALEPRDVMVSLVAL